MGTLTPYVGQYIKERRARGEVNRATSMRIGYCLSSLDKTFGRRPFDKLTRVAIERWSEANPQWKPSTRAVYYSYTHEFARWLLRRKVISHDPFAGVRTPRRPRPTPRPIPHDAATGLLAALPDNRARLIVTLLYSLGLRCCGVSNLRVDDVDWIAQTVHVNEKGGNERVLPLMPDVAAVVGAYLAEHPASSGPLVRSYTQPWKGIGPQRIGALVSKWMSEAGVKARAFDGRNAHALRHSALTAVAQATGDVFVVMELAGWASPAHAATYVKRASTSKVRAALEARSTL